jgi:hypothetical protein
MEMISRKNREEIGSQGLVMMTLGNKNIYEESSSIQKNINHIYTVDLGNIKRISSF